jgi:hypothetical protein
MLSEALTVEIKEFERIVGGVSGTFEMVVPVGNTGITFMARVPGIQTRTGVTFTPRVNRAVLLRAASTLAHWGMRDGGIIAFMREALSMLPEDMGALCGVSEAVVAQWESDQVEMPRLMFDTLAEYVCRTDQRSYGQGFQLIPPDLKSRGYWIYPPIPKSNTAVVRGF